MTLMPTENRNGPVVAAREVIETDEVMMITKHGMIIRTPVRGISLIGRMAKGVRVINLNEGDALVDMALLAGEKDDGVDSGGDDGKGGEDAGVETGGGAGEPAGGDAASGEETGAAGAEEQEKKTKPAGGRAAKKGKKGGKSARR